MSRMRDVKTAARIKFALIADSGVGGLDIGVRAINGIVFLTGTVQLPDQKSLAEDIARHNGALDIKNDIAILSEEAVEEIPLEFVGRRMQTDTVGDGIIRDRINGDIENDTRINTYMVNVDVVNGVVRLYGSLSSDDARRRVEEIAKRVDGVQQVINDIEVRDVA